MKLSVLLMLFINSYCFAISGDTPKQYEIEKQLHKIDQKIRKPGSIKLNTAVHVENNKQFEWKKYKENEVPKRYRRKAKKNEH